MLAELRKMPIEMLMGMDAHLHLWATNDSLEIEREVKRKKEGLVDADNEKRRVAAETPILEHIGAFEKSISRNSGKHVKLTITRLKRLIAEAELKVIGDS